MASSSSGIQLRLTLVRHGETAENLAHVIQGQSDTLLNPTGREQGRLVGARLSSETFTFIYSSDLIRAKETADLITSQLAKKIEIRTDARLRERCFGDLEGKSLSDLVAAARQSRVPPALFVPSGGETVDQMLERADDFLQDLLRDHCNEANEHVLVVSHGGLIRALLDVLKEQCQSSVSFSGYSISPNTGVTSLLIKCQRTTSTTLKCISVNPICVYDASHLK